MRTPGYVLLLLSLLVSCSGSVEDQVELVMTDADRREEAIMRLMLAPEDIAPVVIQHALDSTLTVAQRVEVVRLLRRIYAREADQRIADALWLLVKDREPTIRREAVRGFRDVGIADNIPELSRRLDEEQHESVLREIVEAVNTLGKWKLAGRSSYTVLGGTSLSADDRLDLENRLQRLRRQATTDSMRVSAEELLYRLAGQIVQNAEDLVLQADLDGATGLFDRALELAPESENVVRRYAKFLLVHGDREHGVELFKKHGMFLSIPHRRVGPHLDGRLDDDVWNAAVAVDSFYQSIRVMRTTFATGHTKARFFYTDAALYAGLARFGEDTRTLRQQTTSRDGRVWEDDQMGFSLATDIEANSSYHIIINSLATFVDGHWGGSAPGNDWNGDLTVAAFIGPDYWSLEVEVPFSTLDAAVSSGDLWMFNTSWGRTADSQHARWVCSHGFGAREALGLAQFE